MEMAIPILSLVVALLAVFVGPLISLRVARRQVLSSLEVANKQVIAPMRQAWINSLRDLLAEFASTALHYFVAGYEDRTDAEYLRLTLLEHKIQLMLNAKEDDHRKIEGLMREMLNAIESGPEGKDDFQVSHPALMGLSKEVLKREWDRVKDPIKMP
jgi:hypothetical protein